MLNLEHTLSRNPELVHAEIDNQTMLMSLDNGEYYGMNSVGSAIWQLLEEDTSIGNLIENLTEIYGISSEQCAQEIAPFLKKLQNNKIIIINS